MPKKLFVGVDVGRDSLVTALCSAAGKQIGKSESFPNNSEGFKQILHFVNGRKNGWPVHFVTEATGVYGLRMVDFMLAKTDWTVSVLNPAQVKAFVQSQMARTKTDHTDSYYIAQYGLAFEPPQFRPAPPEYRELESIMAAIAGLKTRAQQTKNRLHSYRIRPHQSRAIVKLLEAEIVQDEADIESGLEAALELVSRFPVMKREAALLKTIPGVGDYSALFILPRLVMLAPLFDDCRKFLAYCGLVPEDKQSGLSIHFRPKLSKKGNPWLRAAIYYPALTAARYEPEFKAAFDRAKEKGKTGKQALVVCMAKLLRICWGVYRSGKAYDPERVRGLEKKAKDFA